MSKETILQEAVRKFGIEIDDDKQVKLWKYAELLIEKNKVMNLTAITEPEEIAVKHFADSMSIIPFLKKYNIKSLIDVGTGAGFPGIPVKIMCPEIKVVLLDSLDKRVKFLRDVIESVSLEGIDAIHDRAESCGSNPEFREKFDASTARAVAAMPVLVEYCVPFLRSGGYFFAMRGNSPEADYGRALKVLGCKEKENRELEIPYKDESIQRKIIVIEKNGKLPMQYPRKAGIPSKKPL